MTDEADSSATGDTPEPVDGVADPDAVDTGGVPEPDAAAPEDVAPGEVADRTEDPDAAAPTSSEAPAPAPAPEPAGTGDATPAPPALDVVEAAVAQLGERMVAVEAAVFAIGSVGEVLDAVTALEQRVDEVARLGDRHNELIDRLHAENQSLRKGELTQAVAPIFRDLIRLSDQLAQLDETSTEPGKGDAALAGRQVLEILARSGVRPEDAVEGEAFDSAAHQGIGRRATDDPDADGTIASVRRPGFVGPDGKLLRAAEVEVWRYEAPAPAGDGPSDETPAPVAVPPPEAAPAAGEPAPPEPPTEPAAPAGDTEGDD